MLVITDLFVILEGCSDNGLADLLNMSMFIWTNFRKQLSSFCVRCVSISEFRVL